MSKKQKTITEEEIRGVIRAFQRAGGLIKVLPDEDTPPRGQEKMARPPRSKNS